MELSEYCHPECASNRDADWKCNCHVAVIARLKAEQERYQRLLYWALMQKDGQDVPWNGEFRFNHEQGLAWFLNQAELEALGGE